MTASVVMILAFSRPQDHPHDVTISLLLNPFRLYTCAEFCFWRPRHILHLASLAHLGGPSVFGSSGPSRRFLHKTCLHYYHYTIHLDAWFCKLALLAY